MEELQQSLQSIIEDTPQKLVLSKPTSQNPYKKTEVCKKQSGWQCSNYTQTQVFHQNISEQELFSQLCQLMEQYRQLNAWTAYSRWDVMISKKGKVTAKRMHELFIHTGRDLRACSLEMLTHIFGKAGKLYYDFARGIDERPVEVTRVRKSIGCEHTLERDRTDRTALIIELYHVAVELAGRLKRHDFRGNTLTLKVKFHDFTQITRSLSTPDPLTTLNDILPRAKQLLAEVDCEHHAVRLLGLSVSNPHEEPDAAWRQLRLPFPPF